MIKQNISKLYITGLIALLVVGCLIVSVGGTWARFRMDYTGNTTFKADVPASVVLGVWDDETEVFTSDNELVWTEIDGKFKLDFAISNNSSYDDQIVKVRMMANLNVWDEDNNVKDIVISDGTEEKYTMHPERIGENTSVYYTFGDGWIFTFFDEEGKEAQWLLEGGKLSVKDLDVIINSDVLTDIGLVQLQIVTDFTD